MSLPIIYTSTRIASRSGLVGLRLLSTDVQKGSSTTNSSQPPPPPPSPSPSSSATTPSLQPQPNKRTKQSKQEEQEREQTRAPNVSPSLKSHLEKSSTNLELLKSAVSDSLREDLDQVLSHFRAPIRHAFAYGSSVFTQAGYSESDKPLLDLVFVVTHPSHWHSINLQQNPHHYSSIPRLSGSGAITWLQDLPANMWFNVNCQIAGRRVKYGVIAIDALSRDLLDWETLYAAGRMQKPTYTLRESPRVALANQINMANALRTAILSLPESFSEERLYQEITSLSYKGDFRMQVGENPQKVNNIVSKQMDQFKIMYEPLLPRLKKHIIRASPTSSNFARDMSLTSNVNLARKLPTNLRDHIRASYVAKWSIRNSRNNTSSKLDLNAAASAEENEQKLWQDIVSDSEFTKTLDSNIKDIVSKAAWSQSLKGIISAGPLTSVSYAWPKLTKKWFSS